MRSDDHRRRDLNAREEGRVLVIPSAVYRVDGGKVYIASR